MVNTLLSIAQAELDIRPLVAVDRTLEVLAALSQERKRGQLPKALSLFYSALLRSKGIHVSPIDQTLEFDQLFDRTLDRTVQRFIAISLIRLLSYNAYCFKKVEFRIGAFELFDRALSEDVYKSLKINRKEQTYEKQSKLEGIVSEIELDFSSFITSIDNLKMLPNFRQGFMQRINKPLYSAIIVPFLPRELLNVRLESMFTVVDDYMREKSSKGIQLFEAAKENLHRYSSDARQFGTKYSVDYLSGLAEKLNNLIVTHFEESPMSKSTQPYAYKMEKKYPLHDKGKALHIGFMIHNPGPGYAFNTSFRVVASDNIVVDNPERYLGHLQPGDIQMELLARVSCPKQLATVSIDLNWTNYNGATDNNKSILILEGQETNVDWENLVLQDPYSLEPVTTDDELVGRSEILNRLIARVQSKNMGSSYIHGQKRVGKTSIVRTLQSRLNGQKLRDFIVVYLDSGDYIYPDARETVESLGRMLCAELRMSHVSLNELESPSFSKAITPLAQYLRLIQAVVPDLRILFILDEFDELPTELYKPGSLGDSFFLTLRSISGRSPFGFILVGGERIPHIISYQGDKLNKFDAIRVDYFDKQEYWSDFQSLVRKPVENWLEISDDALVALYDQTSGHPYFTKLICGHLFKIMVQRRDCHVTRQEVDEATKSALTETAVNSFKHLWDDDIASERREVISVDRRKTLLAFAEAYRQYGEPTKEEIIKCSREYVVTETVIETNLRDFVGREVFILEKDIYKPKIRLFGKWLVEKGISEIISTLPIIDPVLLRKKEQEEATISPKEIVELTGKWGNYRGRTITEDKIRVWLGQFGSLENQRLMFQILTGVTFYSRDNIRSKMKEAHGIVIRGLIHRIEGRRRRRDILVSYLDKVGKSGAQYAKLYADENDIYHENVVERAKLDAFLKSKGGIQAIVFADDFIGTGNSACDCFEELAKDCGDILRTGDITAYLVAVCGFDSAIGKIGRKLKQLDLPVTTHVCDVLDDSAKCFSDTSHIFTNPTQRETAKDIASSYGIRLQKLEPLGFGNCQATIAFEDSCPNNSLPILWDRSSQWMPIFERL